METKTENMSRDELLEHYDFYVDNCQEWEIPISFDEWRREYQANLEIILDNLQKNNMNATINISTLASELADLEIENTRNIGEVNVIEDENGCIVYNEKTQDIFNDLYDKYYKIIESCKIN